MKCYSHKSRTRTKLQSAYIIAELIAELTLSLPIPLRLYTLSYQRKYIFSGHAIFNFFDIRALWRRGLSARVPEIECQKLKIMG